MNFLLQFYPGDWVTWIVVCVLIQTTLAFATALVVVRCFAKYRPATRHGVLVCALLAALVSPVLTTLSDSAGVRLIELPFASRPQRSSPPVADGTAAESNRGRRQQVARTHQGDATARSTEAAPTLLQRGASSGSARTSSLPEEASKRNPDGLRGADTWRAAGGAVATVWLTVALASFVRLMRGWLELRALRRESRPLTDMRVAATLRFAQSRLGMRVAPIIACSAKTTTPMAVGIVRPVVLLPESLVASATDQELRHLLLHECAHVIRRDCLTGMLQRIAQILYWPHPLVYSLNRQIAKAREEVCDNYVLQCSDRTAYGETLLQLSQRFRPGRVVPAAVGFLPRRWRLEHRIDGILDPRRTLMTRMNHLTSLGFMSCLLFLLVVIAGTTAQTGETRPDLLVVSDFPQGDPSENSDTNDDQEPIDGQTAQGGGADAELEDPFEQKLTPMSASSEVEAKAVQTAVPRIVKTSPATGATDVDPSIGKITVTFDQDMSDGMSWTGGGPEFPPIAKGKEAGWKGKRTCVLPVKLERGRFYRVGINSTSYLNFCSVQGIPAAPAAIYFTTKGASEALKDKVRKPRIVAMTPANGAKGVDPALKELRVTFSVPMSDGFSWTGGGSHFPAVPDGKRPSWTEDRMTCVLPVKLESGSDYRLGINSRSHKNFQSAGGVPLDPVVYAFATGGD